MAIRLRFQMTLQMAAVHPDAEQAWLIKVKDGVKASDLTVNDITDNPKHLQILELEAAQLPRSLMIRQRLSSMPATPIQPNLTRTLLLPRKTIRVLMSISLLPVKKIRIIPPM